MSKAITIINEKFIIRDLLDSKDPTNFIVQIVRYTKATNINL